MGRTDLRLILCHLGGSGSLAAVKHGVCIDTTMGLGLQCGVLQNNRIGDMGPLCDLLSGRGMRHDVAGNQDHAPRRKAASTVSPAAYPTICGTSSWPPRPGMRTAATRSRPTPTASKVHRRLYRRPGRRGRGGLRRRHRPQQRPGPVPGPGGPRMSGPPAGPGEERRRQGRMDLSATGSPARIYVVDTNEELMVAQKARALLLRTRDAARKGDTL